MVAGSQGLLARTGELAEPARVDLLGSDGEPVPRGVCLDSYPGALPEQPTA